MKECVCEFEKKFAEKERSRVGRRMNRKEVEIGCCASNCYIYLQFTRKSSTEEDLIHLNILFLFLTLVNRLCEELHLLYFLLKESATAACGIKSWAFKFCNLRIKYKLQN